ncbi:MAG: hypothetical protein WC122_00115 [archaeon]
MERKKRFGKAKIQTNEKELIQINYFKKNKPIIIFLVKFFIIFAILEFTIISIDLSFLTNLITSIIGVFLRIPYAKNTLFVNSTNFVITNSCTGLISLSILTAITLPLKRMVLEKRLLIILLGGALVLISNIPRIILVIYSGFFGFDTNFVHELTWFLMSGLIVVIWYYGLKLIQKEKDFSKLI